jgi:hypothetical protein
LRLYLLDVDESDPLGTSGTEITGVNFQEVSNSMGGGGRLIFTKRDIALATHSSLSDYIWPRVEVRKNDGSTVIWEGYITYNITNLNKITYFGIQAIKVLDKIWINNSSIYFDGSVTSMAEPVMTDVNAAFDATAVGKVCLFSDVDQPGIENSVADASTDFFEADNVNLTQTGTHADLTQGNTNKMVCSHNFGTYDAYGYGIIVYFAPTNIGTSTHVKIVLGLEFFTGYWYGPGNRPKLWIYRNADATYYDAHADVTGIGELPDWGRTRNTFTAVVKINDNIADFVDAASKVRVKVDCGDPGDHWVCHDQKTVVRWARCQNTYAANFITAGSTKYTIDAQTATTLTFTDQTPATDGIATGDIYTVGDYQHNVMADFWASAEIDHLTLDYDASTIVDSTDHYYSYIGPVLRQFALRDGREVYQKIGWEIECKSSLTDNTLNFTEADFIGGFSYTKDGNDLARVILLQGANNDVIVYPTPEHATPQGLVSNNPECTSQAKAETTAATLATKHGSLVKRLEFTLDDTTGTYTGLDVGTTSDVAILTNKITITAGVIRELRWIQHRGSNLYVEVVMDG